MKTIINTSGFNETYQYEFFEVVANWVNNTSLSHRLGSIDDDYVCVTGITFENMLGMYVAITSEKYEDEQTVEHIKFFASSIGVGLLQVLIFPKVEEE